MITTNAIRHLLLSLAALFFAREDARWRDAVMTIEEHGCEIWVREDVQPSWKICFQERPYVAGVNFGDSEKFSPVVLEALHRMPRIGRLDLEERIVDEEIARLAGLETLEELHLRFSNVTDEGLTHLVDLPNLQRVYLTETEITGSTFDALARACPQIDTLFLNETKLTLEGVGKLRHFRRLSCVDLSQCEIDGNVACLSCYNTAAAFDDRALERGHEEQ